MGNVVLVHGAWGGPWCWDAVASELRSRGHEVRTPELHRGSLGADTAAVQAELDAVGGPAVVCGWSYGGMVITGLEAPAGSHLVYVAAMLPGDGDTAFALSSANPSKLMEAVVAGDDGSLGLVDDDAKVADALWADLPADEASRARRLMRPQALATMIEPAARLAYRDLPSTYVVCTRDQAISPDSQRSMAARASAVVEMESSHSPMLSRPGEIAALIDKLAL